MNNDALFTSVNFTGEALKNRMVLAPLTRGRAGESRIPNNLMADYYAQRSGAGLIITEATAISPQANGWVGSPGIYTNAMVDGWKKVTQRVHQENSKIVLQLWHTGRASHSDFHNGELPVSASAIKINGDEIHTPKGKKQFETPRSLSIDEIGDIVESYKVAAQRAKEAGFDGVEVHAANGYLINQFLDSRSNQRDDEYGGNVENRFRILSEVLDAVLQIWPSHSVGVRISPNGTFNDMGADDYFAMYEYAAKQFQSLNIGYVHIMDGLEFGFHERGRAMTLTDFRKIYSGLIMGNCGYTAAQGVSAIEGGDADLIAYGRPFITNPDLPARFKNNWPLTAFDDPTHWYGGGAEGYTDYSFYHQKTI